MAHLGKVAVWERADGGVSITYFDMRDMLPGESEDDFIERMSTKHGKQPLLQGATRTILDKSDIPSDINRDEWSLKNGKVTVDSVKVAKKQAKEAKKQAVFIKLGLTEDEFKSLK